MGTSFDCQVSVSTHPESGKVAIVIGPLDMSNLAEMVAYLGTEECREMIMATATRAFMADDSDAPQPTLDRSGLVHLRMVDRTACDLPMWTTVDGQRRATLASVGTPNNPQWPVTCPGCLAWIERQP